MAWGPNKDGVVSILKWSDIHLGQSWRNKATGRVVIVLKTPPGSWGSVQLLHQTGRKTSKQAHYFIYDYELVSTSNG